jgi:hypothetical protein
MDLPRDSLAKTLGRDTYALMLRECLCQYHHLHKLALLFILLAVSAQYNLELSPNDAIAHQYRDRAKSHMTACPVANETEGCLLDRQVDDGCPMAYMNIRW